MKRERLFNKNRLLIFERTKREPVVFYSWGSYCYTVDTILKCGLNVRRHFSAKPGNISVKLLDSRINNNFKRAQFGQYPGYVPAPPATADECYSRHRLRPDHKQSFQFLKNAEMTTKNGV